MASVSFLHGDSRGSDGCGSFLDSFVDCAMLVPVSNAGYCAGNSSPGAADDAATYCVSATGVKSLSI